MEKFRGSISEDYPVVSSADNWITKLNYSPRAIGVAQGAVCVGLAVPFLMQRLGFDNILNRGLPEHWRDFGVDLFGVPWVKSLSLIAFKQNNPHKSTLHGAGYYSFEELVLQGYCGVNNWMWFPLCKTKDILISTKGVYDGNDMLAYGVGTALMISMDLFAKYLHDSGKTDFIYRTLGIEKRRLD